MAKPLSDNSSNSEEENYCYNCQVDGHNTSECPQMTCEVCNLQGHTRFSRLCRGTVQVQEPLEIDDEQPIIVPPVEDNAQYCAICQVDSHDTSTCPDKQCVFCNEKGHIKLNCPKYKNMEASPLSKIKIRTDLFTEPNKSPASTCSTYHVASEDSYKPLDSDMEISDDNEKTPKVEQKDSEVSLSPSPPPKSDRSGSGAASRSSPGSSRHRRSRGSRSPRRSRSPGRGSGRRSRSPLKGSRVGRIGPGRRSRSPGRRSRTPGRRSRSPGRRSRSPGRSSHRRSRSPGRSRRRSRTPPRPSHRRSRSPGRSHRHSRSQSRSPRRRTPPRRERSRHEDQISKDEYKQDLEQYQRKRNVQEFKNWAKNLIQGTDQSVCLPSTSTGPPMPLFSSPPPPIMGRLPAVIPTHSDQQLPSLPQPVPAPTKPAKATPKEPVIKDNEVEKLWLKNWWTMKSDYTTACSSLITLKMLPSTWNQDHVHDFLLKCGLKPQAHYSHCGFLSIDSGYRSIQVQFYNKLIAKYAMMKMCSSVHKPEAIEVLFQVQPVKQDSGIHLQLEPELCLPSRRVGAPRQHAIMVCFTNVIMTVQMGTEVTEMCFTLQDHCLTYVSTNGDLVKFLDSICSLLIQSTNASSASNKLQKAMMVFESKLKAYLFFKLAKDHGILAKLRPLIAQVRVLNDEKDIVNLVLNHVTKPPSTSFDTVKDKSIGLDEVMHLKSFPQMLDSKLTKFSVEEVMKEPDLKLVPCFVLIDRHNEPSKSEHYVYIKMKLQGTVSPKSYILTDDQGIESEKNREDPEGNNAIIINTNKGIAKVIECLTGWLDSVGGDRLILCTTSPLVISALFQLSKGILDCFAGCIDLMTLLGETIKYDQDLSKAYQPVCLPLEYILEKYCRDLDPKKIKTSLARLESVFEHHNTLKSEELKAAMKPIKSRFDHQHLNMNIDGDQKAFGSEFTNLKLKTVWNFSSHHFVYTSMPKWVILPIKLYGENGSTYLHVFNYYNAFNPSSAIDFQNDSCIG